MGGFVNVGDVLAGKYKVDRVLGIGGMGMVVAATHLELDQRVALKFMLPDALANEAAMARFMREAKAAVKLRSEHICRVHDVGKLDTGAPYIVMEYLEGQDFAQLIKRRGPLPVAEAVDLILQALEGLAEAHGLQIVHRDLKPGNLYISQDSDGTPLVKVLDFGISKSSLGGSSTKTGDIMGSPAYMSPEQMASAKNVDGRADLWAIGVILYQVVTGRMPFDSETLPGLCMAVMNTQPPSLTSIRGGLSPAFAGVVMKCLEKRPEARFANVAALAAAMAPFGGPEAHGAAKRIAKVLGRGTKMTPVAVAFGDGSEHELAVTQHGTDLQPAPQVLGGHATSTLQSSAAELSIGPIGKRRRFGVIAGAAVATMTIGAVVLALAFGGRGGSSDGPSTKAAAPAATTPLTPKADAITVQPIAPPPAETTKVETPPRPVVVDPPKLAADPPPPPPVVDKPVVKPAVKPTIRVGPTRVGTTHVTTSKPPPDPPPPTTTTTSTSTSTVNPDDKWTHMQHDKEPKH